MLFIFILHGINQCKIIVLSFIKKATLFWWYPDPCNWIFVAFHCNMFIYKSDWTQDLKSLCMRAPNAWGSLPSRITEKNRQVCAWRDERGVWYLCWMFEVWAVMRERCVDVEAGCLCGLLDKSLGLFPLCEHYCSTTKLLCISACPFMGVHHVYI